MAELMELAFGGNKKRPGENAESQDYKRMRVATLRQELATKGLDLDGSKEILVSRLEQAAVAQAEKEAAETKDGDAEPQDEE